MMASSACNHHPLLILGLLFLVTMISSGSSSCCCCSLEWYDSEITTVLQQVGPRKVGGRTEVGDVETNMEVQELGHFAVEEFNRQAGLHDPLFFSRVVQAQRQVVSGIKYYLLVLVKQQQQQQQPDAAAAAAAAVPSPQEDIINVERVFQAVVVLKPWLLHDSKQLISFKPSQDK